MVDGVYDLYACRVDAENSAIDDLGIERELMQKNSVLFFF